MATKTKENTSRCGAMLEFVIYGNFRWHYKNESNYSWKYKKRQRAPKKKGSEASMKYTRVEGREASLPVKSPGLHSLFYLRIQRSNKNNQKIEEDGQRFRGGSVTGNNLAVCSYGKFLRCRPKYKIQRTKPKWRHKLSLSLATVV